MDPSGAASRYNSCHVERSSRTQQDWNDPARTRDAGSPNWRDPFAYDAYDDSRYEHDAESEYRSSLRDEPRARRWLRAIAAGLQAAAWWLRRHAGEVSLMVALAVGTVAGLAVLASHVSAVATLVMSALGLAYLLDVARLSSALLD